MENNDAVNNFLNWFQQPIDPSSSFVRNAILNYVQAQYQNAPQHGQNEHGVFEQVAAPRAASNRNNNTNGNGLFYFVQSRVNIH